MKSYLFSLMILFFTPLLFAENQASSFKSWSSKSKLDTKTKRIFMANFEVQLADKWKGQTPEILIKTLNKDGCIQQRSNVVVLKEANQKVELIVPGLLEFHEYEVCVRTKKDVETFRQIYRKKEKAPEVYQKELAAKVSQIVFHQKPEPITDKSGVNCVLEGIIKNVGSHQAKDIVIHAKLLDGLGKPLKEWDIKVVEGDQSAILDGGDFYGFREEVKNVKGVTGAKFSLAWAGEEKTVQEDSGVMASTEAQEYAFDEQAGTAQVTKIITQLKGKDLELKITLKNDLKISIHDPVIEIKLTNDKGELIQPITLPFEGELGSGQSFEIPFVHKNAPPFMGLEQSLKYSTKN